MRSHVERPTIEIVDDIDALNSILGKLDSFPPATRFRVPKSKGFVEVNLDQLPGSVRARRKVLHQRSRRANARATIPIPDPLAPRGPILTRVDVLDGNAENPGMRAIVAERNGPHAAAPPALEGTDITPLTPAILVLRSQEVGRARRIRSECHSCGHRWRPRNPSLMLNRCPACGVRGHVHHLEVA